MLEIALHNPRQHKQFRQGAHRLVLARADGEPELWATVDAAAPSDVGPKSRVEIVQSANGVSLVVPGCKPEFRPLPTSFTVGDTRFEVADCCSPISPRILQPLRVQKRGTPTTKSSPVGPSPATLSRWFAALSSLNHWSTSLQELYVQAARCAVEAIGLDGGMVLRRRAGEWEIAASHLPHPEFGIHYDVSALARLNTEPQTLFHDSSSGSASNEPAIVVSPLRNAAGELAGAVYGYRSVREGNARRSIRYLEAHMIELLAGAVSEGIARVERDAETERRQVLLEQAAAIRQRSPVREIATDQREVTLLFADLRNSTALAATLEPNEMYELLSQVMECLTAAVIDHDGMIIDYYGDGLSAMWNAPADQSEHQELACRAALRMLQAIPAISGDWAEMLSCDLHVGIGVHTGKAHVGNTGTRRQSKYGPRGMTVNLTSRVEAATKQFDVPLLVTEDVVKRLSKRFAVHRVCRTQLAGFEQPVELYALNQVAEDEALAAAWQTYHEGLQSFEHGRLLDAASKLATIDPQIGGVPSGFLAEYVNREMARQQRRRSTDTGSSAPSGVVKLSK